MPPAAFEISIITPRSGKEYFRLAVSEEIKEFVDVQVVHKDLDLRQLVLVARELNEHGYARRKQHFLCGHDERHWFVAAVTRCTTVAEARSLLKPTAVHVLEEKLNAKIRDSRKSDAFIRQGEWFFVPAPDAVIEECQIHKDEPIQRAGRRSKAHMAQFAARSGGTPVKVCHQHPKGLRPESYAKLIADNPEARKWNWVDRSLNPELFVKGRISHKDHGTLVLDGWHKVYLSREVDASNGTILNAFFD